MLTAQLISATDLHDRSFRLAERGLFPELIRRLILASDSSVRWLHFRGHEGTAIEGWDGSIDQANGAAPYVPAGPSRWELGTNKNAPSKIKSDFEKRNAAPVVKAKKGRKPKAVPGAVPEPEAPIATPEPLLPSVDRSKTSLVFVVARRWSEKEEWARKQTAETDWHEIHVIDADDLETWLQEYPAVHIWLSVQLNTYVNGALDLNTWWLDWAHQTNPAMQPAWLLAGRTAVNSRITKWLEGTEDTLSVFASTSDEARAVIAASILLLPEQQREVILTHTIVVSDEGIWQQLVRYPKKLMLIPDFESNKLSQLVAAATRNGHRVILPCPSTEARPTDDTVLPHLSREKIQEELEKVGLPQLDAAEKAHLARRSFTAFQRSFLTNKTLQQLWWMAPATARALLPLALLGRWDDEQEGDQELVSLLTGQPYNNVRQQLLEWTQQPNSPVRKLQTEWFIIDPADVWEQTLPFMSPDIQQRFAEAISLVLATPLARFNLPSENRSWSALYGAKDKFSSTLRTGLVATLALISTTSSSQHGGSSLQLQAWVQHQIRELLEKAFIDESGKLLASLDRVLPTLAEAAPAIFLSVIRRELKRPESVLPTLFDEEPGLFHSHAHHTGLLWALEGLAWPPHLLSDSALALAGLSRLDPGGSITNRPINSLREIFLSWHPQTNASVVERLTVLDLIRQEEPVVAWRLMVRLLPKSHDVGQPTHIPTFHWRDWQVTPGKPVLNKDYYDFISGLTQRLLIDAGTDATRWSQLVDEIPELLNRVREPELRAEVVNQLASLGTIALRDEERAQLREEIRGFLNRHRSMPNVHWTWNEEELAPFAKLYDQLQPDDLLLRHAWLFTQWPQLPSGITERAHQKSTYIIYQAQEEALAEIIESQGIACLPQLLALVPESLVLGQTLGRCVSLCESDKQALLVNFLAASDERECRMGLGIALSYSWKLGPEAAATLAHSNTAVWSPEQLAIWLQTMPMTSETWQLAQALGPEVEECYWHRAHDSVEREEEAEAAVRKFLSFRRPIAAATLLTHMPHHQQALPNDLVLETLEFLDSQGTGVESRQQLRGYELDTLLDDLVNTPPEKHNQAVRLAFRFSESSSLKNPELLNKELQQNPGFFVDALGLLYKRDDEEKKSDTGSDNGEEQQVEQTAEQHNRAQYATMVWRMFREWDTIPGLKPDGNFDGDVLHGWVLRARELAVPACLLKGLSIQLGHILSHAPAGPDGVWPHPAVCALLEQEADNETLRNEFHSGCYNRHGQTHFADGGYREQGIADDYAAWAEKAQVTYPATARLLRGLSDDFQRMAQHERESHEREHQLGI